ncbi:MAG: hypothetical protein ABIP48_20905, partial [Planctomycetota bacterium]
RGVRANDPLLVLAPPDGLRFGVRLPRWAKQPLEEAGTVHLQLLEDLHGDEERRFVECRFSGHLAAWKELPDLPGFGVAELACEPPTEAVRLLTSGEQIAAQLVWRPPLHTVPVFALSALLAGISAAAWVLTGWFVRAEKTESSPPLFQRDAVERAVPDASTEFGAEGTMLRMLGSRLRESIERGQLDANLVAAAEWALDRHHARAVRLLALGLGNGRELCDHLERLVEKCVDAHRSNGSQSQRHSVETFSRLMRVLRVISPDDVTHRVGFLTQRLSELESTEASSRVKRSGKSAD